MQCGGQSATVPGNHRRYRPAGSSKKPAEVIEFCIAQPPIINVTSKGERKATVILAGGIQCDLRVVSDAEFPFALTYFTGNKEHNIVLRQRAIQRGLRLNEYGLFKSKEETRTRSCLCRARTEGEIYAETGFEGYSAGDCAKITENLPRLKRTICRGWSNGRT